MVTPFTSRVLAVIFIDASLVLFSATFCPCQLSWLSGAYEASAEMDSGAFTVRAQLLQPLHETYAFCLRTEVVQATAEDQFTRLQLPGYVWISTTMTWANANRHTAIGMSLIGG